MPKYFSWTISSALRTGKIQLNHHSYRELSSWPFGNAVFSWDYDFFDDGTKARRFEFHEFIYTEQMFYTFIR
jgi:hypothetical protein